ncbi:protein of unknown function [Hydrocarboniphaga daqingensis]|uniref:2-oxoadipate dioxygenase/decarboxylase n=1 Tax=Hydrocarboniphaga daqingensis TaxID=490188 RepID=A0A1M5R492_9GAMM|nr:DUF1338 family protein [Hydrocarboniphaga daqingensis]SHH21021.1 protein of unknown function [Hydrocarboniphaga daqingensis]
MTALPSRLPPQALRERFVDVATAKFATQVPDFVALRQLVADNGGHFINDHGAIRTADPALRALIVRAAGVLGLRKERDYLFPAKKLVSFDLQAIGEDPRPFKIFVSQVDLSAFPAEVAALIEADCAEQAAAVDHGEWVELIEQAEQDGGLSDGDAEAFVQHFVYRLMQRNGAPLRRSLLEAVAAVSGEAASALALGPDFNHVTIDVYAAGFSGIDAMAEAMRARGFTLLPAIQGAPGTMLRQTATMAATQPTPVLEADGQLGVAQTEKQFVEIIERNQAVNAWGGKLWKQDGTPLIFRNFLAANAEKIFDAASTRLAC